MERINVSHYLGRKLTTFEQNVTTVSAQQNETKIKCISLLSQVEFPSHLHMQNLGQLGTSVTFSINLELGGSMDFLNLRILAYRFSQFSLMFLDSFYLM